MGEVRELNPGDWLYPHVQVRSYMLVEAEQDPARANPFRYAKLALSKGLPAPARSSMRCCSTPQS